MAGSGIDWEAVEREYRAGVRSLRDIASEFGISDTAIRKRARRDGWDRDLSAKVTAKADALVRKAEVRKLVRTEQAETEREQINVGAQMLAEKLLGQREDVKRARSIVQRLWVLVDTELDHPEQFSVVGELLRCEDQFGNDKLNDLYRAAIGLPQQIKNAKLLADAIKVLIELERRILKLDEYSPDDALVKVVKVELVPLV